MPSITHDQAKSWLKNISNKDRVAILYDADSDGFSSAIIYYDWCKSQKANVKPIAYKRGSSKIKEMNLKDFNKIIITDIGPNAIVEELPLIKDKNVLYVDHHIAIPGIPQEINEYRVPKGTYHPSSRLAYEFTGLKGWLGLSGTLADAGQLYKENDDFIRELIKPYNQTIEEYREKVTDKINDTIIYFGREENFDEAFKILSQLNGLEDIEKIMKYSKPVNDEFNYYTKDFHKNKEDLGGIIYYYFEPKFEIKGALATTLTIKENIGPVIFATPGDKNFISLSARDNQKKVNVLEILKAGMKDLKDANGGGHIFAAGAKIRSIDLQKFKENVKSYLNSKK